MIYAYIRVSTSKQSTSNQQHEIKVFADRNQWKQTITWIEETASGTKDYKKRKLGELVEKLANNDTLVVTELSRLGRSLMEVMTILHELMQKRVTIYSIKENFTLKDDINSQVLAFAFSLSAQIERQLISQRTKEALARAKSEGKKLGRPKGRTSINPKLKARDKEIKELLDKRVSKSAIARIMGVSRGTLIRYLKRKLQ